MREETPQAAAGPRQLLVDFENVQHVDLNRLDDSYRVIIFVGINQKNVPIDLVTAAQGLGGRVEWQRISGEGRNALDFFIAWHLGRMTDRNPRPECIVLSKDRGFDPLLKYLSSTGMNCRRVNSMSEIESARPSAPARAPAPRADVRSAPGPEDKYVLRIVELLSKLEKNARPRRRRTLAQSISAMFQKRLAKQEVERTIDSMLAMKLIAESNGAITYFF